MINGPKPRKTSISENTSNTTQDLLKEINNYRKFFIPLFKAYNELYQYFALIIIELIGESSLNGEMLIITLLDNDEIFHVIH